MLLKRGLQERRHESFSGLRIFQVLSVSVLSGLLWWHSDPAHVQDQVFMNLYAVFSDENSKMLTFLHYSIESGNFI